MTLEMADARPVAVALLSGPVVDAGHPWLHGPAAADLRAQASQKRVLAHVEEKPAGHVLPGPAAKGEAGTADQLLKPGRPARVWPRDPGLRALGKDLPRACPMRTAEPTHREAHPNSAAKGRHVRQTAFAPAVEPPGEPPAPRTLGAPIDGMGRDDHLVRSDLVRSDHDVIHDKAGRQQPVSIPSFRNEQLPIGTSCDKGTDLPHRLHRD